MNIAIAGTGYVGLSLAVLLAQHNHVIAVDIVPEKVEKINKHISPIQDDCIEKYLAEKELDLTSTTDGAAAYASADFVIIAAPTNYDPQKNFFDCSAVEAVIGLVLKSNPTCTMVIKSTIPVGYTVHVREKFNTDRIIFSPEFLRESKALYDNLYPSRIIVGCDGGSRVMAEKFAALLQEGALKQNIDTLPRLLVEKYLKPANGPLPPDYKLYCFHGKCRAILYIVDRNQSVHPGAFFDTDWNYLGVPQNENHVSHYCAFSCLPSRPKSLQVMIEASEALSDGFPFVCCDFYEIDGKAVFGEMTFTPAGGYDVSQIDIHGKRMADYLTI